MQSNVLPIMDKKGKKGDSLLSSERNSETAPFLSMRIYQVFVNVEGLEVRIRRSLLGFIPAIKKKKFGFFAVMMLAAPEFSKPPLLLSLAKDALADEFGPVSISKSEQWTIKQVQWHEAGAAPPMFQDPGCIDQDWGAAWYELGDEKAKSHKFRLAKARLWKGRRAKTHP